MLQPNKVDPHPSSFAAAQLRKTTSPFQGEEIFRCIVAEGIGTMLLVAGVVGSGIMAQRLTNDVALQLLCNTIATGAILTVLILIFAPISGAHFNPAVTLAFALKKEIARRNRVSLCGGANRGRHRGHVRSTRDVRHEDHRDGHNRAQRIWRSGLLKPSPPQACF